MFHFYTKIFEVFKSNVDNSRQHVLYKLNFLVYALTMILVVFMIAEIVNNVLSPDVNLLTLSEELEIMFLSLAVSTKAITMMHTMYKIDYFQNFIEKYAKTIRSSVKEECVRVCKHFCALVAITLVAYSLKPFFVDKDVKYKLIYQIWFPFEFNNFTYALVVLYQLVTGMYGAMILAVWDTYILTLMIFVCGQYSYIERQIRKLPNNSKFDKQIKDIVHHHQQLLIFSRNLNEFINPVMTIYLFTCSIMICCAGFQLTLLGLSVKSLFLMEYIIGLLGQLFLFYWFANEIYVHSMKLHLSTWNSEWFNFRKNDKEVIKMLRNFWLKPVQFYVGPFNIMSLETFLKILQGSYSYLMVLHNLQTKSK